MEEDERGLEDDAMIFCLVAEARWVAEVLIRRAREGEVM